MIIQLICILICNATSSPILIAYKLQVKRNAFQEVLLFQVTVSTSCQCKYESFNDKQNTGMLNQISPSPGVYYCLYNSSYKANIYSFENIFRI